MSQGQDRTDPLARGADEMIWGIPRATALPHGAWRGFRAFAGRNDNLLKTDIGAIAGSKNPGQRSQA